MQDQLEGLVRLGNSLRKIFTETQIKILKNDGKRSVFKSADILDAICLHAAGPRAYNHLYKKGYPLPCRSTLYSWLFNIDIKPRTLDMVIGLMKNDEMSEVDKLCVLAFDEMKVAAAYEYDSSSDAVYEPANYVQLAIVRGLIKSWKQPVFYDYSRRMNADTINGIVEKLMLHGYRVVAIVSDMGAGNQRLWSELGITETKSFFSHPTCGHFKIFVFADAPHLLKLVRSLYVDTGFNIKGKKLTKQTVQQATSHCNNSEVSILFKVN